jgi:hypothetical protein
MVTTAHRVEVEVRADGLASVSPSGVAVSGRRYNTLYISSGRSVPRKFESVL